MPSAWSIPRDEAAVVACLREAAAGGVPVTIAGAGTGITGARVPMGGWVLSLEKLNGVEVHPGFAVVGPGALLRDVQAAAQRSGQFYPPDPTETAAAIGGNIATNASGSRSFKYGSTRRWIEAVARGAGGWPRNGRRARGRDRFRSRRNSPSAGHQEHRRIPAAAGHGLGRSVCRVGRHARRLDRGAAAADSRAQGGSGRGGVFCQRRRRRWMLWTRPATMRPPPCWNTWTPTRWRCCAAGTPKSRRTRWLPS